ncbi:MAG: type II secretion system protein [Rugosibacter sp.]|jgi:type II secretory pathway pseudopilin PulG|nr:type II secretion system protein [Rugosibacter sp.]MDO9271488.1 type II secretion system protein [Rugosibacter sp.]
MQAGDTPQRRRGLKQRGFGYLLVLFAIAAMGLLLAGAGQVWHTTAQREKEADLLFIGNQFRQAIRSYHDSTPGETKQYPATLQDLLEDNRFPVPRRHLRQLYRDPMTGNTAWGLVKAGDRIIGVRSLSENRPFKQAFDARDEALSGKLHYNEWIFTDAAATAAPTTMPPSPAGVAPAVGNKPNRL